MEKAHCDQLLNELYLEVDAVAEITPFPLDTVLQSALKQSQARKQIIASAKYRSVVPELLTLLDVTSVSAARAIRRLSKAGDDVSGIRDALVDLWGRAEAARCLLFDIEAQFSGEEAINREGDLWETAQLLAPDAIAIALRLSEPVTQYVDFASKVAGMRVASPT